MQQALILNAVDNHVGGVLISGERGTAKSTAARALAALLPQISVNQGCHFHCDPENPKSWCSECLDRKDGGAAIPVARIHTPFVNLPVSATEDRVVGTLDIEKAIKYGVRAFEPGVLAEANRGLLYIDEVNLLDDHVVDVLLDSAAMGVNIVEREGISFSHPARFILVGTMNPEEGELRPQLLDRFGLSVEVHGILSAPERVKIIERSLQFEINPGEFRNQWSKPELVISEKIIRARRMLDQVSYHPDDLELIARITTEMEVEGHRADLVILKTARAQAAFNGRGLISPEDLYLASILVLPHRMKRQPLESISENMDLGESIVHIIKGFLGNKVLQDNSIEAGVAAY